MLKFITTFSSHTSLALREYNVFLSSSRGFLHSVLPITTGPVFRLFTSTASDNQQSLLPCTSLLALERTFYAQVGHRLVGLLAWHGCDNAPGRVCTLS
jgi:hypothetical protein